MERFSIDYLEVGKFSLVSSVSCRYQQITHGLGSADEFLAILVCSG